MSYCCTRNRYLLAGSIVINMGDSVINTCWERPTSAFKLTVLSVVSSSCELCQTIAHTQTFLLLITV